MQDDASPAVSAVEDATDADRLCAIDVRPGLRAAELYHLEMADYYVNETLDFYRCEYHHRYSAAVMRQMLQEFEDNQIS